MEPLSELEQDALRELFNIGVGRAASMMGRMVNEEIYFDVPRVEIKSRRDAAMLLRMQGCADNLCGVAERFSGPFQGEALLLFPQSRSLEIVRMMVGKSMPLEELRALEQDALGEVGNIILSSCVTTLAEMLHEEFDCDLPKLRGGSAENVLGADAWQDTPVLFLHIAFSLCADTSQGYLAFLMDAPQVAQLRQAVSRFLDALTV